MRRFSSKHHRRFDFCIKWSEKHLKNVNFVLQDFKLKITSWPVRFIVTFWGSRLVKPKNELNLDQDLYNNMAVTQAFILFSSDTSTLNIHVHLAGSVCVLWPPDESGGVNNRLSRITRSKHDLRVTLNKHQRLNKHESPPRRLVKALVRAVFHIHSKKSQTSVTCLYRFNGSETV